MPSPVIRQAIDSLKAAVAALEKLDTLRFADLLGQGAAPVRAPRTVRKPKAPARPMGCIAAGCKNRSKGPRFRYLCEEHKGARPAQVDAWRKARVVR